MKVWLVYAMVMGYPTPLSNSPEFRSESGCRLYLKMENSDQAIRMFRLKCMAKDEDDK